jgi:Fic family protein
MKFPDFLEISSELQVLIDYIDTFNTSWNRATNLAPEQLKALQHVATIESVGSSTRIEGSQLSDRQVEELLSGLKATSFASRDEQEVVGYSYVMEEVFASYQFIPLTENYIKQLHAMLLQYSDKDVRHRGEYKKFSNNVEAFDAQGNSLGIVFKTSSPFDTIHQMSEIINWVTVAGDKKIFHPLIIIGVFIVMFLAIHPFQDGNGRLSRIITTILLLQYGYSYVPYSSLETIIEATKANYYRALRLTQVTLSSDRPDFNPWLFYFLHSLRKQIERLQFTINRQ